MNVMQKNSVPSPSITLLALAALTLWLGVGQARAQTRDTGWSYPQVRSWMQRNAAKGGASTASLCDFPYTGRRDAVLNGNRITTQILNFGSISAPGNTLTDIVWNGLGYGYEFGPFVAAEVVDEGHRDPKSVPMRDENGEIVTDANGDPIWVMHIVSDGLTSNGGERSPTGDDWWGWQPIPCAQPVGGFAGIEVVAEESDEIPVSDALDRNPLDGRPDSWPPSWYNPALGAYVWPGALQQGASNADKEALYFMNDYSNAEFAYWPFPSDSTKRGLGLEVEVRLYQWANPLAEDMIFLVYKITNKSEKDLDKVAFGMWGDPHIGGPSNWTDDLAYFDPYLNMVFAWDDDGRSDISGRVPGYFGYKFLESPGLGNEIIDGVFYPGDGIDNDGDGMTDESWTDGIDNDNDWRPDRDDVGLDGRPRTGDQGEGDGIPTAGDPYDITKPGEPNFEFTDIDESDMIGLTSFASPPFAGNQISNDEQVWGRVTPGRFDEVPSEPGDYVFMYGSGHFPLRAGETKRFSIGLLLGENLNDLRLNAETAQQIFDVGYRFARPPDKPIVTAVPGDRRVTLHWDDRAERSVDPLSEEEDFEGYVIYRSTDHEFSDQQTITDINGSKFLFRPLRTPLGFDARFDLDNGLRGPSPIPFPKRGVSYDLGDDTGLYHTFVDSNNVVNGQTYYYSVVAYDRGYSGSDDPAFSGGIAPSETSKSVTYNPVFDEYIFDVNTVAAVPRPVAAGYVGPQIGSAGSFDRTAGHGTGDIRVRVVDPMAVPDGGLYRLDFDVAGSRKTYSVANLVPRIRTVRAVVGKSAALGATNIIEESFSLIGATGNLLVAGTDYELNAAGGSVLVLPGGAEEGEELTATYRFRPLVGSDLLAAEEANLVFDGLHLFVDDDPLRVNLEESGWATGGRGIPFEVVTATSGPGRKRQPFDYEITFSDQNVSTGYSNNLPLPFRIVNLTRANEEIQAFVPDLNRNGAWDVTEQVVFLETLDGVLTATWQVNLTDIGQRPGTGDVLYVRTDKPFTDEDAFTLATVGAFADPDRLSAQVEDCGDPLGECIYVVPNPYVATNELEPRNPNSRTERGDRRLYFAGVPARATIRIFTLAGELVDTIEHDSPVDDGKVFWDLRTKDEMSIAYGLYLFHVEWPAEASRDGTAGSFIGKFAVIK